MKSGLEYKEVSITGKYEEDSNLKEKELGKFLCLDNDIEKIELLMKYFAFSSNGLIPQPWFGNISNPKIVILGKNPGFKPNGKRNDIKDNEELKNELERNLSIQNRNNSLSWIWEQDEEIFLLPWWWKTKFFGNKSLDIIKDYSPNIGIFNLYSYYSYSSDFLDSKDFSLNSHLSILNFKSILEKSKVIVFLWGGAVKLYEEKLKFGKNYFENLDIPVYIGNKTKDGTSTGLNTKFYDIFPYNQKARDDNDIYEKGLEPWLKEKVKDAK